MLTSLSIRVLSTSVELAIGQNFGSWSRLLRACISQDSYVKWGSWSPSLGGGIAWCCGYNRNEIDSTYFYHDWTMMTSRQGAYGGTAHLLSSLESWLWGWGKEYTFHSYQQKPLAWYLVGWVGLISSPRFCWALCRPASIEASCPTLSRFGPFHMDILLCTSQQL